MDFTLDAAEARVLGSLLEKEIATPDYYPLSVNALVNACNQKSNREPVVDYDDCLVEDTLELLRAKGLAVRITGTDSRVPKHAQRFTEKLNLGRREAAVVCLLLLRGPQTVGELRSRADRLYRFDDLEAVENTLNRLAEMGMAMRLPRRPGFKEQRWMHLLSGEMAGGADLPVSDDVPAAKATAEQPASYAQADRERIAALERGLSELRGAFEEFRKRFE